MFQFMYATNGYQQQQQQQPQKRIHDQKGQWWNESKGGRKMERSVGESTFEQLLSSKRKGESGVVKLLLCAEENMEDEVQVGNILQLVSDKYKRVLTTGKVCQVKMHSHWTDALSTPPREWKKRGSDPEIDHRVVEIHFLMT